MPAFSAWSIRASLLYLLAGFVLGGLLLANKGLPFYPPVWRLLGAHIDFLLFGWILQLVFGVAFWILPRLPGGKRGRQGLAWLSLGLLNLGIWITAAQGFWGLDEFLLLASRVMESAAALLFAVHAWPRIRPFLSVSSKTA